MCACVHWNIVFGETDLDLIPCDTHFTSVGAVLWCEQVFLNAVVAVEINK